MYSIQSQRVDPAREDVYLASVDDQEAVLRGSAGFGGRLLLRSQLEAGAYWLVDAWADEGSMQMALAAARTLASVAALVEEPAAFTTDGEVLAAAAGGGTGGPPFFLVGEGWVKAPCLEDYLVTVRSQALELSLQPGFRRRLLLADRERELHFWVLDEWADERSAYDSFSGREISEPESLRFLSLFAERGRPLIATGVT